MKKYSKAGLLIFALVIPALIFTFLHFFATNHYKLPTYHPISDSLGNVKIVKGDTLFYKVSVPALKSPAGKVFPEEQFADKLTIVNYLPKACNDSCMVMLDQLKRFFVLRENIPDLNLLSVTTAWSQESLKDFPDIGKPGWQIGIFTEETTSKVLFQDFRFQTKVPGSKTKSFETKLILVDRAGSIRGYYDGTDKEDTDRLMAEIKILDYEKKNKD